MTSNLTSKKSLLIIFKQDIPQETQLGIDMALAGSAFEINLSILFLDKPAQQLIAKSGNESTLQKQIKAWPWYDIQHVYITDNLLNHSDIHQNDFILPVTLLTQAEIESLITAQDIVLSY